MVEKKTPAEKKPPIDWELVEKHYRAGILTLRQVGAECKVSHVAIQKRATRLDWQRGERISSELPGIDRSFAPAQNEPRSGFVYCVFVDAGERLYKIGLSTNPVARIKDLQVSQPFEVRVAACFMVGDMRREEALLHERFASQRVRGEWFRLSGDDLDEVAERALLV